MFGRGERLKAQALDVILETANGLPVMSAAPVYSRMPGKSEVAAFSIRFSRSRQVKDG
jgi:hypothetical protein